MVGTSSMISAGADEGAVCADYDGSAARAPSRCPHRWPPRRSGPLPTRARPRHHAGRRTPAKNATLTVTISPVGSPWRIGISIGRAPNRYLQRWRAEASLGPRGMLRRNLYPYNIEHMFPRSADGHYTGACIWGASAQPVVTPRRGGAGRPAPRLSEAPERDPSQYRRSHPPRCTLWLGGHKEDPRKPLRAKNPQIAAFFASKIPKV
jgi:hypothetical protein